MRFVAALAVLVVAVTPASAAHPIPNDRYDRTVHVRVGPTAVVVSYDLAMTGWGMILDGKSILTQADEEASAGSFRKFGQIYAPKRAAGMAPLLRATLDGQPLAFRVDKIELQPDPNHLRFRFVFRADWKPSPGVPHKLDFEDANFADKFGVVSLTLVPDDRFIVIDLEEPADLRLRLPNEYPNGPADAVRARKAWLQFELPGKAEPEPTPVAVTADPTPPTVEMIDDDRGLLRDLWDRGLPVLFDDRYGLGVLLAAAALFGVAHAFAPGHGKTVAAAFLVGERGTVRQAIVLALATTATHTGSVILIAGVLHATYRGQVPQAVQQWLGLAGGVLVLLVGLWLLTRRLRGQVDHFHLFAGCADACGGQHEVAPKIPECRKPLARNVDDRAVYNPILNARRTPMSWLRVVLLGVGAGAVPCVDAVMLLILAVSAGRLAAALPLLLAFSIGLAAVLTATGVGVVLVFRATGKALGESRWLKALPVASAVLLIGMGWWLTRDAWHKLMAS